METEVVNPNKACGKLRNEWFRINRLVNYSNHETTTTNQLKMYTNMIDQKEVKKILRTLTKKFEYMVMAIDYEKYLS